MKVVILAAGLGTRLGVLTKNLPKPMIEVGGKPILEHTILSLVRAGLTDVILNTHYLPEVIINYFRNGERLGANVSYFYEPDLIGSAGAIRRMSAKFDEPFMVIYGDNFYAVDFGRVSRGRVAENCPVNILVFDRAVHKYSGAAGGVIEVDGEGSVTGFYEGVDRADLKLVNAGVYLLHPRAIEQIPEGKCDFARDLFPSILGKVKLMSQTILEDEAVFGPDTPLFLDATQTYVIQNDHY